MLALPQEYIGATCEMRSMDDYPVGVGRLIEIDHDAVGIAALDDERIPLLQYRQRMKILVRKGELFKILVGMVYLSTNTFARFEEVVSFEVSEQRNAFRVRIQVEAALYQVLEEDEKETQDEQEAPLIKKVKKIPIEIMDLSLTGVRILSDSTLSKKVKYQLEFNLLKTPMEFLVQVQRMVSNEGHRDQYGCSFVEVTSRQSDVLCNKLFELQRIERTKRRSRDTLD